MTTCSPREEALPVSAAPKATQVTVYVDSTICEVHGKAKHGAAYGHTSVLGYHPLLAVRDDTGEIVHCRMRSGSSLRGHSRFVAETLARLRRLAPEAKVTLRADAGFFSYDMLDTLKHHKASYSLTAARNSRVNSAIGAIDEDAWQQISYTRSGEAQVAQTAITTGRRDRNGPRTLRLGGWCAIEVAGGLGGSSRCEDASQRRGGHPARPHVTGGTRLRAHRRVWWCPSTDSGSSTDP